MEKSLENQNQKEGLSIQSNAKENNKYNSSILERENIVGTPFTMIRDEQGWFLVMGNHLLVKPQESKLKLLEYLDTNMWDILITVIIIVIQENEKIIELNKKGKSKEKKTGL